MRARAVRNTVGQALSASRLVIGIPTVPRRSDYVAQTVDSIVAGVAPADWARTEIVVFDASLPGVHHPAVSEIESRHGKLIASGRLTILRNPCGHPQLRNAVDDGRYPNEAAARADWRRKVVLDFIYLVRFCAERGDYYLHVEDDTIAAPDLLGRLAAWFDGDFDCRDDWAFLTLFTSERLPDRQPIPLKDFFSCCALVFRCRDLPRLADYCEEHFASEVLDFLLREFAQRDDKQVFVRTPPLFQHIGLFSSCGDETRPIQAARFTEGRLAMLMRGLRETVEVLRRDPGSFPEFMRWRMAVLVPSLLPLVRAIRGVRQRHGAESSNSN